MKKIKQLLDIFLRKLGVSISTSFKVDTTLLSPSRLLEPQKPPANLQDLTPTMQLWFAESVELPAQLIYRFSKVRVSWHGVVLHNLQVFEPSLSYHIYLKEFLGAFLLRQWFGRNIKVAGTVGLIYDSWAAGNYYHWLIDSLSRLLLLQQVCPNCLLLVPSPAKEYIISSLEALGFETVQPLAVGEFAKPQQLLMPAHIASPGKQDPLLINQLRTRLLTFFSYTEAKVSNGRWVYVSRSKQLSRRLANEYELESLLLQYQIEIIYFEDISFAQQIQLMQNVEVLIGVHGANLSNMLFLSEGSKVIELFNANVCNPCYYHLASNLALSYYAVPCDILPESGDKAIPNSEDILVKPSLLQSIFKHINSENE